MSLHIPASNSPPIAASSTVPHFKFITLDDGDDVSSNESSSWTWNPRFGKETSPTSSDTSLQISQIGLSVVRSAVIVSEVGIGSSPAATAATIASVSAIDDPDDDDADKVADVDADAPATAAGDGHDIDDGVHSQLLRKSGLVANASQSSCVYVPIAPSNWMASHRNVNGGARLTKPRPSSLQTRSPAPQTLHDTKTGVTGEGLTDGSFVGDMDVVGALLAEGEEEGSGDSLGSSDGAGEGMKLGDADGIIEGTDDGLELGAMLGVSLGARDGTEEGEDDGILEGDADGTELGVMLGVELGAMLGVSLGASDGRDEGEDDGTTEGLVDGTLVGFMDGEKDGINEIHAWHHDLLFGIGAGSWMKGQLPAANMKFTTTVVGTLSSHEHRGWLKISALKNIRSIVIADCGFHIIRF
mmetsp:Transcript_47173/g.115242  ORF Transcript_47173/g.115242 Transcript_47173/m.115242 type:complete len:413 (-) Transcript_47173:175-1413(-)